MEITKAMAENDLRFPIGKFDTQPEIKPEMRGGFVKTIKDLPLMLAKAVENLDESQLETPYRDEGWTVRQTVHHVADSHLNAYIRFKLALTEDKPTIRPYAEDKWAELADSRLPLDVSFKIIEGVHTRWSHLLDSMSEADFQRKLVHPDSGEFTLEKMLALYDWHSRHHTAHITSLRERLNW